MTISKNRPCRKPDYRLELLDNELLLFHPTETQILYCNETASVIWQLCDGQRTVPEIVDMLRAAFPEAVDTIAGDVHSVLETLVQRGAIEFV